MFLQDKEGMINKFIDLNNYGGLISQAHTAEDIKQAVMSDLSL
jgi:hypothetical protein